MTDKMAQRNPKLTKKQIAQILDLRRQGWTSIELQRKFKRGKSVIGRVLKQKMDKYEGLSNKLAEVSHELKQEPPPMQAAIIRRAEEIEKIKDMTIQATTTVTRLTQKILERQPDDLSLNDLNTAQNTIKKAHDTVAPAPSTIVQNNVDSDGGVSVNIKFV